MHFAAKFLAPSILLPGTAASLAHPPIAAMPPSSSFLLLDGCDKIVWCYQICYWNIFIATLLESVLSKGVLM
jgi:hypothetical protein